MVTLLRWFKKNSMKANQNKFQSITLGITKPVIACHTKHKSNKVKQSQKVVLLGLIIDD